MGAYFSHFSCRTYRTYRTLFCLALLTGTLQLPFGIRGTRFEQAAVASEHPQCSQIGKELLEQGGSAVDAAIGALLCVGVVNNFSAGIGGGGFMLVRVNSTYSTVIDYRETAPKVDPDVYAKNPKFTYETGLSVAVPGQIRGFEKAHQMFGKLPWASLFKPNIELARNFTVGDKLAKMIERFAAKLQASPALRETYFRRDKAVPKRAGETVVRENLARTLNLIAVGGADTFYSGMLAENMVAEVRRNGGALDQQDLASYVALERRPVTGTFLGYTVISAGAPASGAVLINVLNTLETWGFGKRLNETDMVHLMVEALKFGYSGRTRLGDPAYTDMQQVEQELTSLARARRSALKIKLNETFDIPFYLERGDEVVCQSAPGTTHISVLDSSGMAVSATDTVNLEFGSCIMDSFTGVLINNEIGDFSVANQRNPFDLPPSSNNLVGTGKRPVSSSTPVILEKDGRVYMVVGAAGGSRIISATVQTILGIMVSGMVPLDAVMAPRIHHQLCPNQIVAEFELGVNCNLIHRLHAKGHKIELIPEGTFLTSVNLIVRETDQSGKEGLVAISDPRKCGMASGY